MTCEACGQREAAAGVELCGGCMEELDPRHPSERPIGIANDLWADAMARLAAQLEREAWLR